MKPDLIYVENQNLFPVKLNTSSYMIMIKHWSKQLGN